MWLDLIHVITWNVINYHEMTWNYKKHENVRYTFVPPPPGRIKNSLIKVAEHKSLSLEFNRSETSRTASQLKWPERFLSMTARWSCPIEWKTPPHIIIQSERVKEWVREFISMSEQSHNIFGKTSHSITKTLTIWRLKWKNLRKSLRN